MLLGIGDFQVEFQDGLRDLNQVFDPLYQQFLTEPERIFCGFYLGYDWNMWFRTLPRERAWYLLTDEGIRKRTRRQSPVPFPVRYHGWEFDILWGKRLRFKHENGKHWCYLNDVGSFFQCSLLKALKTRSPNCEVSDEELELIMKGKERRATAELDDEMRLYNRLENRALEALMVDLDHGFTKIGVPLGKTQYHGPGQASQKWAKKIPELAVSTKAVRAMKPELYDAIVASYYGGIFEIIAHGIVNGISYEYDINSAYPYAIVNLPCVCGQWKRNPRTIPYGALVLQHAKVVGTDPWLGPVPYRAESRAILRPKFSRGWYWKHELDAAEEAGLLSHRSLFEQWVYYPCGHSKPLTALKHLYQSRLDLGKESSIGKAIKLLINSLYGKFAQSIGNPQISNAVYASLITSACRTQILRAIGSHPRRTDALLMIATDAVFFTEPHPGLPLSNQLGDWELKERSNLTIFKPGMYWDDAARKAIEAGEAPAFKARGISARDFSESIWYVDSMFKTWQFTGGPVNRSMWPEVSFTPKFAQYSIKQGLQFTAGLDDKPAKQQAIYKNIAGQVKTNLVLKQSSDPVDKRNAVHGLDFDGKCYRSRPWEGGVHWPESTPYDKRFGMPEDEVSEFVTEDLPLDDALIDALNLK